MSYDPFGIYGGSNTDTKYKSSSATKNAGSTYDPFNIGSITPIAKPKETQTKQVAPPVQPKQSTGSKAKSIASGIVKSLGHAGTAIARPAVDLGSGQGGKLVHDTAQLTKDIGAGGFQNTSRMVNQGGQEFKQLADTIEARHFQGDQEGAQKDYFSALKSGDPIKIASAKSKRDDVASSVAKALQRQSKDRTGFKSTGGVFNTGTLTNEQEAKQGTAKGALKIGAGVGNAATEIIPFSKGFSEARIAAKAADEAAIAAKAGEAIEETSRAAKAAELGKNVGKAAAVNATLGAGSSAANQFVDTGKVNVKQTAIDAGSAAAIAAGADVAGHVVGTGIGKLKGSLSPELNDAEKIALFNSTAEKAKGALKPLQDEKTKLLALKQEHPGQPAIDETIAKLDKKTAEVQKAAQSADEAATKTQIAQAASHAKALDASSDTNGKIKVYSGGKSGFSTQDKEFAGTFADKTNDGKIAEKTINKADVLDTRDPEMRQKLESVIGKDKLDTMINRADTGLPNHAEKGEQDALINAARDLGYKHVALSETDSANKFKGKDVISYADTGVKAGRDSRINKIQESEASQNDAIRNRKEGASAKAAGYRAAALDRSLKGEPTVREFTKAKDYLESNHIGKQVEQGEIVGNSFGKVRVKTPEGKIISVNPEDIVAKAVGKTDVLAHIKTQAESSIKGRMQLNNLTDENPAKGSLKPLKKAEEPVKAEKPPRVTYKPDKAPEPMQTPEIKTSKLGSSLERKAIDRGLSQRFSDLPEYAKVNRKAQVSAAMDLLDKDPERLRRIALGQERPPEGLLPESAFVALEKHAEATNNVGLLKELATQSSLVSEATGMGQRISMLAERDPDSAVSNMRTVAAAKKAAVEKQLKKSYAAAEKETIDKIKSVIKVKPPTKTDWSTFIAGLTC